VGVCHREYRPRTGHTPESERGPKEHQDSREISKGLYDYTKRPKIILIVIPLSGLRTNDCTRDILPTLQVLKQILKE
jgi:hypothetical protein